MGIMTKLKETMTANLNALFDRAEDPEEIIDRYFGELEQDFAGVKAETASIMAEEKNAKRKLDECDEEIARMTEYAGKAVAAGNDGEARRFLIRKAELTEKRVVLSRNYDLVHDNSVKMRRMHDKLAEEIASLKSRRDILKAKVKAAETQEKINRMGSGAEDADSIAALEKMEEQVNKLLEEANAMTELNASAKNNSVEELVRKYNAQENGAAVDDELAALKAEMGL